MSSATVHAVVRSPARDPISELYREHRTRLVALASTLVDDRSAAEDVVQDVFAGLARRWRGLRDPDVAASYLRTAVVNQARSVLRRRRTARRYVPPYAAPQASAEESAMNAAERDAVRRALTTLPRKQHDVLVLRYYDGLSEREIAAKLHVQPGTVKAYANRGKVRLLSSLDASPTPTVELP